MFSHDKIKVMNYWPSVHKLSVDRLCNSKELEEFYSTKSANVVQQVSLVSLYSRNALISCLWWSYTYTMFWSRSIKWADSKICKNIVEHLMTLVIWTTVSLLQVCKMPKDEKNRKATHSTNFANFWHDKHCLKVNVTVE